MAHEGCHSNARILGLVHDTTHLVEWHHLPRRAPRLPPTISQPVPDRLVSLPACSKAVIIGAPLFSLFAERGADHTQNIWRLGELNVAAAVPARAR
jgi:hypothetical protein